MTAVYYHHPWVVVPYVEEPGKNLAAVDIGFQFGAGSGVEIWRPAFADYMNGERVAKVRPDAELAGHKVSIWLRIGGVPARVGELQL